ncbi:thiol-disulfide oxidoreductase DCC family protein [Ureibacillus suwonensis]|uniref:Thiol-disulfide oxidoreductase DCC family protein n=1 Tax=Ureibacillus suwonensis TaxID=313007 RepID=A0ABW0RBP5_9BACL
MLKKIVLFDGECGFCHRGVQFIIKRDPRKIFQFASLESEIGKHLCAHYQVPSGLESLILIENGRYYAKSAAVLRICRKLSGPWKVFYLFWILPTFLRDVLYDMVAKNRHLFGKKDACPLPGKEDLERFLS